ncbi:MAG: hypothetical protein BA861_05275 [Desulfobacterales bacterium S3730MH5]|nr:MAG: hypothetical protein BA861_05275 [Desulfobacterales bacterium S3730MH5]
MKPLNIFKNFVIFSIIAAASLWPGADILAQDKNPAPKRVLAIFVFKKGMPGPYRIEESLRAALASESSFPIELDVEYADQSRFPEKTYLSKIIDLYQYKYSKRKVDLGLAIGNESADLMLEHGEALFGDIPVVLITADRKNLPRSRLKPNMVSVEMGFDFGKTGSLIQDLLPKTKNLFVVSGTSLTDRKLKDLTVEALAEFDGRFAIQYLDDLSLEDILLKVARLPKDSVIFYLTLFRDANGQSFVPRDIVDEISEKANAPTFGVMDLYLGHGIVGGNLLSAGNQGKRYAEIVVKTLKGEPLTNSKFMGKGNQMMFDWRQLKRWSIDEDRLPAGSIVRYREPSIWANHKPEVVAIIAFLFIETSLIIMLWIQIKKRRQAEIKTHKSEERYALAVRGSADGLWDWKTLSGEVFYADRFKELIGYSPDEFPGTFDSFRDHLHPEDLDATLKAIEQHHQERVPYDVEYRLRTKSGEYKWFRARGQAIWDEHGKTLRMAGSIQDINERKQMEKKSQSLRDELNHMSRVLSMGEIGASLAHEINQPLTAIRSYAQAAQRLLVDDTPDLDKVGKMLAGIVTGNRQAEEVIQRIRMLMKNEQFERSRMDVKTFIKEVVSLLSRNVEEHKLSLRLDLDAELPQVFGDRVQLQQVVMNLIINGLEAINAGGDGLRELVVRALKDAPDVVTISVQDSGIGIDEKNKDRIFDAFFSTKSQGMGMGLSISRSIIEEHGGRLWVTQNPVRGATFSFTVPIHKEDLR